MGKMNRQYDDEDEVLAVRSVLFAIGKEPIDQLLHQRCHVEDGRYDE